MDENVWAYLQTTAGFGLVHTQDVEALAAAVELRTWVIDEVQRADLPVRFAYCASPQARFAHSP
jgi:hypothetical protein